MLSLSVCKNRHSDNHSPLPPSFSTKAQRCSTIIICTMPSLSDYTKHDAYLKHTGEMSEWKLLERLRVKMWVGESFDSHKYPASSAMSIRSSHSERISIQNPEGIKDFCESILQAVVCTGYAPATPGSNCQNNNEELRCLQAPMP